MGLGHGIKHCRCYRQGAVWNSLLGWPFPDQDHNTRWISNGGTKVSTSDTDLPPQRGRWQSPHVLWLLHGVEMVTCPESQYHSQIVLRQSVGPRLRHLRLLRSSNKAVALRGAWRVQKESYWNDGKVCHCRSGSFLTDSRVHVMPCVQIIYNIII